MILESNGTDSREIARCRNQVVGQRAGQQLAVCIVDEVLHKRAAKPLHDPADRLTVQGQRVDDAADILDDQKVEHLDLARPDIDRHMRHRRAVGVGQLVVVLERRVDPQTIRRQIGEGERATIARAGAAIDQLDVIGRAAEPSGGSPPDLFEQRLRALIDR